MNDTMSMGMIECFGNIRGDLERLFNAQLLLTVDPISESVARNTRSDQVQEALGLTRIEERQDVRMAQFGRRLDLG